MCSRLQRSIFQVVCWQVASYSFLSSAFAGPVIVLGDVKQAASRIALENIDHSSWNELLKNYVDAQGMVDYTRWKATPGDVAALDAYINHLSTAEIVRGTPRDAQLAYWINAYNAVTIKGILREYPTTSIRNHTAKVFGYNIWQDLQLSVQGKPYSLEQIEHEILRKMGEPRIHFAIVCASIGCPPLRNEAYSAEKIKEQLADNARQFFAQRSKFQFDPQRRSFAVSPILSWFAEDFGTSQAKQLQMISPYLPEPTARQVAKEGTGDLSYLDYDWNLNDQATKR